eukprot:TRINITY_DN11286_c0_g2_i1.p4 TRINITY_DN11286_c0_g2~~TRINITY_DN11286_c0_g2_i1.p4  ORF type:complete len:128 (+),score=30.09 TRINITY_DN11286_c0_g2_i1:1384-1767(+)
MALTPDLKMQRDALNQIKDADQIAAMQHAGVFNTTVKKRQTGVPEVAFDRTLKTQEPVSKDSPASSKQHRDDRQAAAHLDINAEESERTVPIRTSSLYGNRAPIDNLGSPHGRKPIVQQQFYTKSLS